MVTLRLAHIADFAPTSSSAVLFAAVAALAIVALALEHSYVKHGGMRLTQLRVPVAAGVVVAVVSLLFPPAGAATTADEPTGLPDLVSDPPFIWFNKNVELANGETARVMAFDGYIHNIGTGSLRISGNPQIEDGMRQQVFNGETWEDVGTPTVRFETDDGHNHFHLISAVEYQLWDETRTTVMGNAQKVGFCLIDTEQIEETYDAFFKIEDSEYCGVDSPDLTELTMGITPGWRDTYEASITFQWVDISNVLPGRYWVSALTDPRDEIRESNEDNNDIVFSRNRFSVEGYNARALEIQGPGEIRLKSASHGQVGERAFVISEGPANGSFDIPIGVDHLGEVVRYTPNPGFVGTDSFTYFAHDTASNFPHEPLEITVSIEVTADDGASTDPEDDLAILDDGTIVVAEAAGLAVHGSTEIEVEAVGFAADEATWFGTGLPPGLTVDRADGTIAGVPTIAGSFEGAVIAFANGQEVRTATTFVVADGDQPALPPINDFSTPESFSLAYYIGTGQQGAEYEAIGLPEGTSVPPNVPVLAGEPQQIGEFPIEIREIIDGEVVNTIEFVWRIEPSIRPAFVL